VLRKLKADEELKMVPVVILSSSNEDRDVAASYRLGASAYVVKPMGFLQFLNAIKKIGAFWVLTNEPPPGCISRNH